jgi:hypothetical protein
MIYFLESQPINHKLIKIGFTSRSVQTRFKENQRASPAKLNMIGFCEGDPTKDKYLKKKFEHFLFTHQTLTSSEWFWPKEELMEFIKNVRNKC